MTKRRKTTHPNGATRLLRGAVAGLLSGVAGVAAAEAASALLDGVSSPLFSVANRAVDAAPRPVKEWAIESFGSADKTVLISGVIAVVALLAIVIGVVGVRRPRLAMVLFLVLSAVSAAAAIADRAATASTVVRLVPVLVLVVVGLGSLVALLRAARARPTRDSVPQRVGGDDVPAAFDRRAFLQTVAAVGAIAAAGGVVTKTYGGAAAASSRADLTIPRPASMAAPLPEGATLGIPGITPYLTPNTSFYRVDTALRVPDVPVDGWRLRIHGMVDKELDLSFEDLVSRRLVERRITLTCVSNPVGGDYAGNATWIGVPLADLLAEAGVQDGADAVKSTSADDFTVGTPLAPLLEEDRWAMVAVAMNGEPLPLEHGFPARMVVPGLYGYVSATKWLVDLEVTRFADFKAYWTTRGYAAQAEIKTSSRIDVPKSFAKVKAGPTPVAGVAWSQDRGIDKVEVRVDAGDWHEARLAAEDNVFTWRQWVWQWDATPGNHRIEVRATDSSGYTQTSERAPIAPDGSTGWDSTTVMVT